MKAEFCFNDKTRGRLIGWTNVWMDRWMDG